MCKSEKYFTRLVWYLLSWTGCCVVQKITSKTSLENVCTSFLRIGIGLNQKPFCLYDIRVGMILFSVCVYFVLPHCIVLSSQCTFSDFMSFFWYFIMCWPCCLLLSATSLSYESFIQCILWKNKMVTPGTCLYHISKSNSNKESGGFVNSRAFFYFILHTDIQVGLIQSNVWEGSH